MSVFGAGALTLSELMKRLGPDDKIAKIGEVLNQKNPILQDIPYVESNLLTGHEVTIRTGLPTVAWRMYNRGVPTDRSTTAQVTEAIGHLGARSQIDKRLADLGGNRAAARLSEAGAYLEAMNQEMAQTLFYGNSSTAPEEFNGLSARYSSTSAANGRNIINGGGNSGNDQTSIWLICWGPETVFGIYPKGSKAGLTHEDLGELDAFDANDRPYRVLADEWGWNGGLCVKDWRFCVRIANIDTGNLVANSSPADIPQLMTDAQHAIESMTAGKCVYYMNRTIMKYLDRQRVADVAGGGGVTWKEVSGMLVPHHRGIPIRVTDAIVDSESVVS